MNRLMSGLAAMAFALAQAPALAQDAGVAIPLSTTLERSCEGRLEVTYLNLNGAPLGAPQVVPSLRGLFAQPDPRGIALTQWAREPVGEGRVIATIAPDGSLLDARVEGPLIDAIATRSATPLDREALARGLAQDIPERLVAGRRFQVGETLYTPEAAEKIADQLVGALGLQFPVETSANVRFLGLETLPSGREAYVFEGPLQIVGQGQTPNGVMGVAADYMYRVGYDRESGLAVLSENGGAITISLNGQSALRMQTRDSFTCTIAPRSER